MSNESNKQLINALVCLDLEGTLISNAVSQIPRPHLFEFLEALSRISDIALFTSVSEERTEAIKILLVDERFAPKWFKDLPSLHPKGTIKSMGLVPNRERYQAIFLVDDQIAVVEEGESDWHIHVKEYRPPYRQDDRELIRVLEQIQQRANRPKSIKAKFRPSRSRLESIGKKGSEAMEQLDPTDIENWRE
ncbi:NIF family HAD-type phosphatase [Marinobacter salarius]